MLGQMIAQKLRDFEPRLRQVNVTLEADPSNPRAMIGSIEAMLVIESVIEPISFLLLSQESGGLVKLVEAPDESPRKPNG